MYVPCSWTQRRRRRRGGAAQSRPARLRPRGAAGSSQTGGGGTRGEPRLAVPQGSRCWLADRCTWLTGSGEATRPTRTSVAASWPSPHAKCSGVMPLCGVRGQHSVRERHGRRAAHSADARQSPRQDRRPAGQEARKSRRRARPRPRRGAAAPHCGGRQPARDATSVRAPADRSARYSTFDDFAAGLAPRESACRSTSTCPPVEASCRQVKPNCAPMLGHIPRAACVGTYAATTHLVRVVDVDSCRQFALNLVEITLAASRAHPVLRSRLCRASQGSGHAHGQKRAHAAPGSGTGKSTRMNRVRLLS